MYVKILGFNSKPSSLSKTVKSDWNQGEQKGLTQF